jgi:hypothetical protein
METMEGWDLVLLVVVGYLAVHMLTRLMLAHRNRVVQRLRGPADPPHHKTSPAQQEKIAS